MVNRETSRGRPNRRGCETAKYALAGVGETVVKWLFLLHARHAGKRARIGRDRSPDYGGFHVLSASRVFSVEARQC